MENASQRNASISAAHDTPSDWTDRVLKLRWLGMQQEAEELHMTLRRVPHTNCVIVMPRETD